MFTEQRVVAAPGVDADALGRVRRGALQAALHLEPEAKHVPLQRTVLADRFVRKAADLVEREDAGSQAAEHGATAFGAEIDREKMSTHAEGSHGLERRCPRRGRPVRTC